MSALENSLVLSGVFAEYKLRTIAIISGIVYCNMLLIM